MTAPVVDLVIGAVVIDAVGSSFVTPGMY